MTREKIVEKLKEVFALAQSNRKETMAFEDNMRLREDFGITSVEMMYLAIAIEEHFGIDMDDVSTVAFVTLGDVIGFLEKNIGR